MRLMRSLCAMIAALGLFASLAFAADIGSLDEIFDNTIRITSAAGEELIYFNRDGTFTSTGPAGDTFGTWKLKDDELCTKTKDSQESCGVIETGRKVGDSWEHKLKGETVKIEIVKGR